jgi:hypothetical protein
VTNDGASRKNFRNSGIFFSGSRAVEITNEDARAAAARGAMKSCAAFAKY